MLFKVAGAVAGFIVGTTLGGAGIAITGGAFAVPALIVDLLCVVAGWKLGGLLSRMVGWLREG